MRVIEGRVFLRDLARRLGVTNQALRLHLHNSSGLGVDAVKFGDQHIYDDWMLSIDSVLAYLSWAMTHSKKLKFETLEAVLKEVQQLKN